MPPPPARPGKRAGLGWVLRLALIALTLIALPIAVGLYLIRTDQPNREEPPGVGFVPPLPASPGNGFALSMLVDAKGCKDTVHVTVVAAGSANYWVEHASRLRRAEHDPDDRRPSFRMVLPDVRDGTLHVWRGTKATDVQVPQDARDPPGRSPSLTVKTEISKRDGVFTIVSGDVPHWTDDLAPIVVGYDASGWVSRRGLGSCFVQLPALTGDLSVLSAQFARHARGSSTGTATDIVVSSRRTGQFDLYDRRLDPVHGSTTVAAASGEVSTGESLPPPATSTNGSPTWTCHPRGKTAGLLLDEPANAPDVLFGYSPEPTPGALSRRALQLSDTSDCSALAVLVESSAGLWRDAVLLLVGAFISLGFAVCIELWVARAKERPG
jgi:hypothetical protein